MFIVRFGMGFKRSGMIGPWTEQEVLITFTCLSAAALNTISLVASGWNITALTRLLCPDSFDTTYTLSKQFESAFLK